MTELAVRCCECGNVIAAGAKRYEKISGYEEKRDQGGANMIVARQPLNEFACVECIDKMRNGIDPAQARLI